MTVFIYKHQWISDILREKHIPEETIQFLSYKFSIGDNLVTRNNKVYGTNLVMLRQRVQQLFS